MRCTILDGQAVLDVVLWLGAAAACGTTLLCLKQMRANVADRQRLIDVIDNLSEGYYITTMDGVLVGSNPAMVAICGDQTEKDLLARVVGNAGDWYVDKSRHAEFKARLAEHGRIENFVSEVDTGPVKGKIWISENARLVRDPKTGKPTHYEGTVVDITDTVKRSEEEGRLRKLASHVPGGLFQLERKPGGIFDVIFSSSGFRELLDHRQDVVKFDIDHFLSLIHPNDLLAYSQSLRNSRLKLEVWSHSFQVVTDGGKPKWLKVQATPELKADGTVIWHGYLQDVTSSKADEDDIRALAFNDSLTKLPNRRYLADRLQQTIAACGRRNDHAAVLFIDIDSFKLLNDTHGHDAGDKVLVEMARRLTQVSRKNDTVARLAGDEFVVLMDDLGRDWLGAKQNAGSIAEKVLTAIRKPFKLGEVEHRLTCSIGVITFDGRAKSVDDILKFADTAMYNVKKSGRNAYQIFEEGEHLETESHAQIARDLKNAISRNELILRFQPQVNRDGVIVGAEALIRWNHPSLGLLTPDMFMPIAEQNGQIREIGKWVLDTATLVLVEWQKNHATSHMQLAVNISAQQFLSKDFVRELRTLIKARQIPSKLLTLEFTEQVISKNRDNSVKLMQSLKTTGVRLSLDDFGTGFSSLGHLKEMALDEVKIDGKFVKDMQSRPKDMALVRSILAMSQALGLTTVAEHVEIQSQENFLMENGCDVFQGYLYSGAMTLADFEASVIKNASAHETFAKVA
jgi:diguanylate cyclase (GGDEF)-like protein